jgi:DsbC/DsbD-like thiol-disulfide interchange protein
MVPIVMFDFRRPARIAAAACLAATIAGTAFAAEPAWVEGPRSAIRLVEGASPAAKEAPIWHGGVEIRLDPGWKTYWRYPGDSGVPPRFDFSRSENLAEAKILWPAPQAFDDGAGGRSIGYLDRVVFPLQLAPRDPRKPIRLRLSLDYAVCEKVCIPADAKAELTVTGRAGEDAGLAASRARVPRAAALGDGAAFAIRSVKRDATASPPRVIVEVAAPAGQEVTLLAEGPTPDWALPIPEPIAGAGGDLRRFAFELDGLPPGASPDGAALRLTAVTGADAIEVTARLD